MATKYYVTVNKAGKEPEGTGYGLNTTRKAEYTKFAKNELKNGAESVDVHAAVNDQCTGTELLSYIGSFYPEDFNINQE